jgi:YVTN family beta-propeller protein
MTNLTHKFPKQCFGALGRVLTLTLFLLVLGAGAALAQTRGYVTDNNGTIAVIDVATHTEIATVPVGGFPDGIAVTPDSSFIYVSLDNTVAVISALSNRVITEVARCWR